MIRLLESKVKIRCKDGDQELVKAVIPDAKKEFEEFLKEKTGKEVDLDLELQNTPLSKGECVIGGVVLYCHNNKIVFTNTLDSRLDLGIQENTPKIRELLFGHRD